MTVLTHVKEHGANQAFVDSAFCIHTGILEEITCQLLTHQLIEANVLI